MIWTRSCGLSTAPTVRAPTESGPLDRQCLDRPGDLRNGGHGREERCGVCLDETVVAYAASGQQDRNQNRTEDSTSEDRLQHVSRTAPDSSRASEGTERNRPHAVHYGANVIVCHHLRVLIGSPMRRSHRATTGLLIISALTLTGCAHSVRSTGSTSTTSASSGEAESATSAPSASPTLTETPSPSATNGWGDPNPPTFVEDPMDNFLMYFPEAESHDTKTIHGWVDDVCTTEMNNGGGYNFLAEEEGFILSTFDLRVSSLGDYGTEPYAVPKVLAHHFCPNRERHVFAVQKFHEANEPSE